MITSESESLSALELSSDIKKFHVYIIFLTFNVSLHKNYLFDFFQTYSI